MSQTEQEISDSERDVEESVPSGTDDPNEDPGERVLNEFIASLLAVQQNQSTVLISPPPRNRQFLFPELRNRSSSSDRRSSISSIMTLRRRRNELMLRALFTMVPTDVEYSRVLEDSYDESLSNRDFNTGRVLRADTILFKDSTKNTEICMICQENFTDESIIPVLPCNHFLHENCLNNWIKQKAKCPFCETRLDTFNPPLKRQRREHHNQTDLS